MRIDAPLITGSLSYNGTSLQDLSTYATTSSVDNLIQKTGSYALTGSNYFSGSQTISGSITATGNITAVGNLTAQTLIVQTITSSVDFVTGSTRFGSIQANTHEFTGSFGVTGSATFSTTVTATSLKSDGASAEGLISIERDTVSTNTVIGSLNFTNNNAATTYGRVRGGRNSAGDGYVSLGTGVGDNLYALEGGSVGIGTTSPATALHVDASGGGVVRVTRLGAGSAYTQIEADGSNGTLASSTNLNINAGGSTRLYVSSSGNVGIGTTAPSATLHTEVNSSTWTSKIINTNTSTNNAGLLIKAGVNSGNEILLAQKANGTSVFLVDASGYVGIGTTAPNSFLDIQGASAKASGASTGYWHSAIIDTTSAAAGVGGGLQFMGYKTGTAAFGFFGAIAGIKENGTAGNEQGALTFYSSVSAASGLTEKMRIGSDGTKYLGTYNTSRLQINPSGEAIYQYTNNYYIYGIYNDANSLNIESAFAGNIIFKASNQSTSSSPTTATERMRIVSAGFVKASNDGSYHNSVGGYHELASNASGDNSVIIANTSSNPYGPWFKVTTDSNNSSNYFLYCGTGATGRMVIRSNGGIANYQANDSNLSDERTKKDIIPIESYWDKFKDIEVVKFKYKDQTHDDFNIGVIAQQVEQVAPEFVDNDGWGKEVPEDGIPFKSIYTADLHHATIKVLQEAMQKIESLEAEIEILKNK